MTTPVEKLFPASIADGGPPPPTVPKRVVLIPVPSVSVPAVVRWPFLLFVFTLPFEAADLGFTSGTFSLTKISGFLFCASCLLYPRRCFAHSPRALWWFLGYLIIFVLNGASIPKELLGKFFSEFFTLVQLIVLFWIASGLLQEEKLTKSVLLTFSIASVLLSLGTIFGAPGFGSIGTRMTALDYNPNALALLMAFAVVILVGLLLDKAVLSLWKKATLAALTLPLFLLIIQTGSRAGVGSLILGISLYLLPYQGAKQKIIRMLWAALTIIGVVYMALSNPVSSSRWEKAYAGNVSNRDRIYENAMHLITERPFFGWKPVAAQYELEKRLSNSMGRKSAHNLFLHLLMEGGIIGTVPFLVALWLCAQAAWKGRTGSFGMLPLALLVTILAYCMTHTSLTKKLPWLILALAGVAPSFIARGQKRRRAVRIMR